MSRRPHTSVVVLAGNGRGTEHGARALAGSLGATGIEIVYLGREPSARRIAASAADARADAVEVCIAGGGGVSLLLELLRELRRLGRPQVSIVVHRVQ
jgi:methylmalonyl-CoA mutase cobalamin-binding domain/chain